MSQQVNDPTIQIRLDSPILQRPEAKARDYIPAGESVAAHAMQRDCAAYNAKWRKETKK